MYAVVNHLRFREPIEPGLFTAARDELTASMQAIEGFGAFHVIQTSERDAVLMIVADTPQALERVATEVGSPWMRAAIVPLLDGPPDRQLGPVIASTQYR